MSDKDDMTANPPRSNAAGAKADAAEAEASGEALPEDMASAEEEANAAGVSAQLRGLYQGLLSEPIPDRFTQLLKELESKESESK
jgi:hypothetical protein